MTGGFVSDPRELRTAGRNIDVSVDELEAVAQRLRTTDLTHDDWGASWLTEPVREAYSRAQAVRLDEIAREARELRVLAAELVAAAARYERADQAVAERADGAAGAAGGPSRPSSP